jgi:putative endonuclease
VRAGRRELGREAEALVADALADAGWIVLERNWRSIVGEVDIVAREGDVLVLVEVRSKSTVRFGTPEESVGPAKRARLAALAEAYVQQSGWDGPFRVDVVAVRRDGAGPARLTHYRDALLA